MFKPALVFVFFCGACLMHVCLLFLTFHHRHKFSSLRGPLGATYKIIVSKTSRKLEVQEEEIGGSIEASSAPQPKSLSLSDMKQHIELIDKIKSQPEHKLNLNPNEFIQASISESEKAIAEKHEKLAKEHEKLLAMELELEKVSKNHPDQSLFSSNLVGSLSVNLVLREIESGIKMHPDLVADARKIHESGKFRRSPGSENVGVLMNSHPSVLSKYIFFPSIAEVMISEKLSGRPIPKSLEQQMAYVMKIHPIILDKVINHPELVGNVQKHSELRGKLKNFDLKKSMTARSHLTYLHTV